MARLLDGSGALGERLLKIGF